MVETSDAVLPAIEVESVVVVLVVVNKNNTFDDAMVDSFFEAIEIYNVYAVTDWVVIVVAIIVSNKDTTNNEQETSDQH